MVISEVFRAERQVVRPEREPNGEKVLGRAPPVSAQICSGGATGETHWT